MSHPRPAVHKLKTPRAPSVAEDVLGSRLSATAVRRPGVPLVEVRLAFALAPEQISKPAGPLVLSESVLAGTSSHDREGLTVAVERLGGSLSAVLGGDQLVIAASVLATRLAPLLEIIAEVLSSATYPSEEVAADRARQADEVTVALSLPGTIAEEAFARRLFGRHPYATPMPRPPSLLRVAATSLRRLHGEVLRPDVAHLVVVGDVQAKRALSIAEDALGGWIGSAGAGKGGALPPLEAPLPGGVDLVGRPGSVQSNLRMGAMGPSRAEPDWPAASLANEIAGGMFTSRLVENLRERNGYTYSPRSSIEHSRAGSTFRFRADVGTDVTAAALVETRYELGRIATTGVTEEEVEGARRHAIGSFLFQTATQAGLASSLAAWALCGIGPGYLASYPAALARAKQAEVEEAARRYLAPSSMATVVVGDPDRIAGPLGLVDSVTA